jgi:hypothetical protein
MTVLVGSSKFDELQKRSDSVCYTPGVANFFVYEGQYMMSGSVTGRTLLDRT